MVLRYARYLPYLEKPEGALKGRFGDENEGESGCSSSAKGTVIIGPIRGVSIAAGIAGKGDGALARRGRLRWSS